MTPGLSIAVASPGVALLSPTLSTHTSTTVSADGARASTEGRNDYFSQKPPTSNPAVAAQSSDNPTESVPTIPTSGDNSEGKGSALPAVDPLKTPGTKESSRFGKRLLSTLNKSGKMFASRSQTSEEAKTASNEDKTDESSDTRSSHDEVEYENSFRGFVLQMRAAYADAASKAEKGAEIPTFITPSMPNETPVLKPPPGTTVIIQEDRAASGGVVDLFEGKVEDLGFHADLIEGVAPTWLAETLLRVSRSKGLGCAWLTFLKNRTPLKEQPKLAFVVEPYNDLLPRICNPDG